MSKSTDTLPYHIIIDQTGVFYGPLGTAPFSRDWFRFPGSVADFVAICSRESFAMSPDDVWTITADFTPPNSADNDPRRI